MTEEIKRMDMLIQKQSLTILEQKEKIERLEIENARLNLTLRNLNAPQK